MEVGECPAIVGRVSLTGELGFEIYLSPKDLVPVYEKLKSAANDSECKLNDYGIYALLSLRMEKSYGIWSREFSPNYTPRMCGLDRFVAYDKPHFIGRDAALRDRDASLSQMLVTLEIDAGDSDAGGYEPIWLGDHLAGFVTSGGYGHAVKKSLALGYLQSEYFNDHREFEVTILGERRFAQVLDAPAYDPDGRKMR